MHTKNGVTVACTKNGVAISIETRLTHNLTLADKFQKLQGSSSGLILWFRFQTAGVLVISSLTTIPRKPCMVEGISSFSIDPNAH